MEGKTGRSKAEKRNNQKWVDGNYDAKVKARDKHGKLPYTPALETSDHPISRDWSTENLPEILFFLNPPLSKYQGETPHYLIDDETGDIARSEEGNKIKDFEILPRYISVEVEGWMVEAWRRIDTRITYQDILDRQRTDSDFGGGIGLKKLSKNALQNHCYRDCRKVLHNWVEYGRRDEPHRTEVETIEELSYDNIVYNTVLSESFDFPGRLEKVAFKRRTEDGLYYAEPVQVTAANVCRTTFDKLHFLGAVLPSISPYNYMTISMDAAWRMSLLLMERARMHGKQHWSKLDRQCLPVTWFDRLKKKQKTLPNPTYDGGCAVCTWTEGRDDGVIISDKRKSTTLITPHKRYRVQSDSNSDEPLIKKRRRGRAAIAELNSDDEIEDETLDDGYPRDVLALKSPDSAIFTTPVRPQQPFRTAATYDEDYDAEMEDCDDDATEGVLSLERRAVLSLGGLPDPRYQVSPSRLSAFESPLPSYSSSPFQFNEDNNLYRSAALQGAAVRHRQPRWEEVAFSDSAVGRAYELPYPTPDQTFGSANYQGSPKHGEISFTSDSAYLTRSFSSGDLDAETVATSFQSGNEMNDLPYGVRVANAKMQQMLGYEPASETQSHQVHLHHPGRMNTQGSKLTDIFSSPPPRMTCDFDITSNMYQPRDSVFDSDFSRRRSFTEYVSVDQSLHPYGQSIATNIHWGNEDLAYTGSHLALQVANQFLEHRYSDLPKTPTLPLPAQTESKSISFLTLLSSDPIVPEEYQDLVNYHITNENYQDESPPEDEVVMESSATSQNHVRLARPTPPLLEY